MKISTSLQNSEWKKNKIQELGSDVGSSLEGLVRRLKVDEGGGKINKAMSTFFGMDGAILLAADRDRNHMKALSSDVGGRWLMAVTAAEETFWLRAWNNSRISELFSFSSMAMRSLFRPTSCK